MGKELDHRIGASILSMDAREDSTYDTRIDDAVVDHPESLQVVFQARGQD